MGTLRIDAFDESSIWWGLIRNPNGEGNLTNDKETLAANKTYTLHAGFIWGALPRGMTYEQEKAASDDAVALSGVTVSWTVDSDPDGAVASITPSADTHTCAVTIDYSKLKAAPNSSDVTIKAVITSELREGANCWGVTQSNHLGTGRYGYYFLLSDADKTTTSTVHLSK